MFLQLETGFLLSLESSGYIVLEAYKVTDQIEIQIPHTIIYEETSFTLTAYFRNRATQEASIPTTIHYRVDCLSTKRQVTDWTLVSTPAANNTITITSSENQILDDSNSLEVKQITIKVDSGLSTQAIKPAMWKVRNLLGIQ